MLAQHDLHVNRLSKATTINGHTYDPTHAYVIPMDQRHSLLLRSLLECNTHYKDSLFYDLSTWNMSEAYGLKYAPLKSIAGLQGEAVATPTFPKGGISSKASYAYLLDNHYQMQPTMLDESTLSRADLSRYNVLILSGELAGGEAVAQQIANWVKAGGTLITIGNGYQTANKAKLTKIETIDLSQPDSATYVPYDKRSDRYAEFQIPDTDLQVSLDITHPLCWGYTESVMPILKNSKLVFKMPKEANLAPVCYGKKQPLLSGFIRPGHLKALTGMPEVICQSAGKGQVICFADDPNFRSVWYAGTRLFMNALLFGNLIRE